MSLILVVDDDACVRQCVKDIIETLTAHRVELTSDGDEAHALCRAGLRPDLVITDRQMERMGGDALAAHLRLDGYAGPILLMSGRVSFELHAPPQNVSRTMTKPFNIIDLVRTIDELLCGR